MFLKTLSLRGFKSFAEKTALTFEPGVSVVVGPNGSGKSNITDAFLWVMGEQSPTSLRGEKMEDVIFSGGGPKKQVGMSEVEIILDNTEGALLIEFQEVRISRRLYSSGESEYRLNGAPCRLLDLQEVLSDTGLGKEMHSVVSQGRIEEILMSKPADRRAVIEEAAGLAKFKKRRDRSLSKLQRVDENLSRLVDIEHEVDKQLRPLERQAKHAKKFEEVKGRADKLELKLLVNELTAYKDNYSEKIKEENDRKEFKKKLREELLLVEESISKLSREAESSRNALAANDLSRSNTLRLGERLTGMIDLLGERVKKHQSEIKGISAGLDNKDKEDLKSKISFASVNLKDMIRTRDSAEDLLGRESGRFDELKDEAGVTRAGIESIRNELINDERLISDIRNRREVLSEATVENSNEIAKAQSSISDLEKLESKAVETWKKADEVLKKKLKKVVEIEAHLKNSNEKVDELSTEVEVQRLKQSEIRSELIHKEERLLKLENREKRSSAVKEMKSLWGEIQVEKGFEKAASAALGVLPEVFVCESLGFKRDGGIATRRVGFLEKLKKVVSPVSGTGKDLLINHIQGDPSVIGALNRVIGEVIVIDEDDGLTGLPDDVTTVTIEGDLMRAGVFLITGSLDGDGMSRKAEIEELRSELLDLRQKLNSLNTAKKESEVSRQKELRDEIAAKLAVEKEKISLLEADVSRIGEESSDRKVEIEGLKELIGLLESKKISIEKEAGEQESSFKEIEKEIGHKGEDLAKLIEKERELSSTMDEISVSLTSKKVEVALADEKVRSLEAEIKSLNSLSESQKRLILEGAEEIKRLECAISFCIRIEKAIKKIVPNVDRCLQSIDAKGEALKISVDNMKVEKDALEGRRRELSGKGYELEEQIRDQMVSSVHIEERLRSLLERINVLSGKPVDERLLTLEEDFDPGVTSSELESLRTKLERMGPVNPLAGDELDEVKERKDFVSSQIIDLRESCGELRSIIDDLERRIVMAFDDMFLVTKEHFSTIIEQLFPGGKGGLSISEEGVEIRVKDKSKPYKKLSLLSGGEKALVAIAFLFAIFLAKPCPFYILDEVEAALDEINISRFLDLVNKFKDRTQFIIITHQKTTMSIADVLYGVTMRSDGVSRVLAERVSRN